MKAKSGALLFCTAMLICGCTAPGYVNDKPTSVIESLPMSQTDTVFKLNKICNNVISATGGLEQQMIKYLSVAIDSSIEDKQAILTSIDMNINIVQAASVEVSSFRPAEALRQKTSQIKYALNEAESYLRLLKSSVEKDDVEGMQKDFTNFMSIVNQLKISSTGM